MKCLTWVLVTGLALTTAGAGAVTFNEPYTGPLKFKFANYESSRIYFGPDGTYTATSGPDGLTLTDLKETAWVPGVTSFGSIAPPGGIPGEDTWGLFECTSIYGQDPVTGQYNVVLWEKGNPGPDIVAMFYGVVDMQVTLTTRPDGLVQQEIWAAGDLKMDMYEVPNASAILNAPTARTAADQYPLWTVGEPILRGAAIENQIDFPTPPESGMKYWSKVILDPQAGSVVSRSAIEGTAKLFVEWYGGSAFQQFSISGPDLEFTTHLYGNDTKFDWTMSSDDPAFGGANPPPTPPQPPQPTVIPEPITMMGLLLAAAGAGNYLRRRTAT
ncbi:MAG: PEP-CTERM sorting domain-containing protein [Phycisphaerae bacterium]|nr:PEP-CTERM sorting domain-containing protein [Phycisphaerae bacterium]